MKNTQILEEAAEWVVTLRDAATESPARTEFARWLCRSPEHVRAYLELISIWADVADIDARRELNAQALLARARAESNVVALEDLKPAGSEAAHGRGLNFSCEPAGAIRSSSRSLRRRSVGLLAAGLAAVCMVSGAAWWQTHRFPTYAAAVGEQRSITLADGSMVELNSRSRIRIRFAAGQRQVELLEGQGLFRVAKDPQRPFVVHSGGVRVRAVGTQFDVYRKDTGTVVTVLEGRVEVRAAASAGSIPRLRPYPAEPPAAGSDAQEEFVAASRAGAIELAAGEQVIVAADRIAPPKAANLATATAWTQRQLVFDAAPLAEVAEEFNRYNIRQLVIGDAQLEELAISGVFSSTDPSSLLRFLREQPDFAVHETDTEIRVSRQ